MCLLLRGAEPARYDRAVLRWLARFAREKAFSLGQFKVAIAAFEGLAENPARSERQAAAGLLSPIKRGQPATWWWEYDTSRRIWARRATPRCVVESA